MTQDQIISTLILAIILAISIGFHEYAHARASNKLGDPTPKLQGRLTPNPLAHLDPLGFLLIFIIHFGRGKPVQIDPRYYKKPRLHEFLVAMAGPASNIIMAVCGILFYSTLNTIYGQHILSNVWMQFSFLNIGLAVFNLLPIPPLDGWKLVKLLIPNAAISLEYKLASNPLLMVIIFVIISRFGIFNFLGDRSYHIFQIIYNLIQSLI